MQERIESLVTEAAARDEAITAAQAELQAAKARAAAAEADAAAAAAQAAAAEAKAAEASTPGLGIEELQASHGVGAPACHCTMVTCSATEPLLE
jgi:chemosensory pili system protein ChpA (sensor histidine kinase/response regulator)